MSMVFLMMMKSIEWNARWHIIGVLALLTSLFLSN